MKRSRKPWGCKTIFYGCWTFLAFKSEKYKKFDESIKWQDDERKRCQEEGEDAPNVYEIQWGSMEVGDIVDKVGRGHHSRQPHLGRVGNRNKSRDCSETAKRLRSEGKQYKSVGKSKINYNKI